MGNVKLAQCSVVLCTFFLSSCASLEKTGLGKGYTHKSQSTAGKTGDKNRSQAKQLWIKSWSLTPEEPVGGQRLTSVIKLIAPAAEQKQIVELKVSRILKSRKDNIQFGRPKVEQRTAGAMVLSWNFTLPEDVDKGAYTLETTISSDSHSETVNSKFTVY